MTAKQLYASALIELRKVNAPALTNAEFNHYANKAVQQYVNLAYSRYDVTQQTGDDLRALQCSARLVPERFGDDTFTALYGPVYTCLLPMDYMHLLNCVCGFRLKARWGCRGEGDCMRKAATRLTSDAWAMVMDDVYNRPSVERPYFQIANRPQDAGAALPLDPVTELEAGDGMPTATGTDIGGEYSVKSVDDDTLAKDGDPGGNFRRTFTFKRDHKVSTVERHAAVRYGNPTPARLEVRFGDDTRFALEEVQVDYLRAPQNILLTQEMVDLRQDTSQILEWPDYVCHEVLNVLVRLLMERTGDPRLATNMQINSTIAPPAGSGQQA